MSAALSLPSILRARTAAQVLCLVALSSGAARAATPDVLLQQTLAVSLGGQEVGTIEALDRRTADGFELVRVTRLKVQRGATSNTMRTTTRVTLKRDLAPVAYRYEREDASGTLVSEGRLVGPSLELVTTQNGAQVKNVTPVPPGTTFALALEHETRTKLKDGLALQRSVVLEELGAPVTMAVRVRKSEKDAGLFVITSSFMNLETVEEMDQAGRTLVARTPAMGIVAYPLGRAPADVLAQTSGTADLMALSTWTTQAVTPPVARVRYRIRAPDMQAFTIPEDERQKITVARKDSVEVTVAAGPAFRGALTPAERARWTSATPYEAIGDPRITRAAAQAAQGAKSKDDEVRRLVDFVHRHVESKGLDRGYAPAVATLESRSGDCTEHSVLLSALLRARGFPTRLVDGVIVDGTRAGYHEWVEVYIEGEGFIAADPTFGAFPAGPERLKLATGSTLPEEHLLLSLAAARLLKPGVTIEVLESAPQAP